MDMYGMEITSYILDDQNLGSRFDFNGKEYLESITSVTMKEANQSTTYAKELLHSYTMDCLDKEQLERYSDLKPKYFKRVEHFGGFTVKELMEMINNNNKEMINNNNKEMINN